MLDKTVEELAVEERRAYYRAWRAANKDRTKKHRDDYWRRKAEYRLKESEADNGG